MKHIRWFTGKNVHKETIDFVSASDKAAVEIFIVMFCYETLLKQTDEKFVTQIKFLRQEVVVTANNLPRLIVCFNEQQACADSLSVSSSSSVDSGSSCSSVSAHVLDTKECKRARDSS